MKKKKLSLILKFVLYTIIFGVLYYFGTDKDIAKVFLVSLSFGLSMTIIDLLIMKKRKRKNKI